MTALGPRIAIISNTGGGKSTLAGKPGKTLNLPVNHLDALQYHKGLIIHPIRIRKTQIRAVLLFFIKRE